eukprot:1254583-Prymnesium_polylepis.1
MCRARRTSSETFCCRLRSAMRKHSPQIQTICETPRAAVTRGVCPPRSHALQPPPAPSFASPLRRHNARAAPRAACGA